MAFQRFKNEEYYAAPDINILTDGLENTAQNLGQFFSSIGAQDRARRQAADQFKFDVGQRKFENDDQIIRQREFSAINQMKNAIKSGDKDAQREAEKVLFDLRTDANKSDIQFKRTEDLIKRMDKRAQEDVYYDPREDENLLKKATHGDDNETYYSTRGENLDAAEKQLFQNPKSFRIDKYTADYVNQLGVKEKTVSTENPNAVNSRYSSSPFWDKTTGAPGVTDQHAVDYLKSREDGSVQRRFQSEVDEELDKEISSMKSSGDPKTEWMKGKSDADIKNELILHPEKNVVNQTDFGVRIREKAKQKLENAADIKSKVDVEYKKDMSKTGGLYNNDSIAYSETFHTTNTGSPEAPVGDQGTTPLKKTLNGAPGGVLMINKGTTTGKPITFESSSRNVFNVNSGTQQQVRGSSQFNLTGYHLQAYSKDGKPFLFEAENPDAMIKKINSMPASEFANLEPSLAIALDGFSVNKAKMLGDVRTETYNINTQLSQTRDPLEKQRLQERLMELEEFKGSLNMDSDDFTDDDVLNAAAKNGVTSVRIDQVVKADRSDLDRINKITEGLDLKKRDKWSQDMRRVDDAYRAKYNEAAATGFTNQKKSGKSKSQAITKTIISDGSDVSTWIKSNRYKVGDKEYYYDTVNMEWKKK